MEKEKLESLLIDYIDGNLNDAERAMVEKELQNEGTAKLYRQLKEVMDLMANSKVSVPGLSLKQNLKKHYKLRFQNQNQRVGNKFSSSLGYCELQQLSY